MGEMDGPRGRHVITFQHTSSVEHIDQRVHVVALVIPTRAIYHR